MLDYLLLMHRDVVRSEDESAWDAYLGRLEAEGVLRGGSAIGSEGAAFRAHGEPAGLSSHLTGFIRVAARDLEHARAMLEGNPVYEAGGTVEVRLLPRT